MVVTGILLTNVLVIVGALNNTASRTGQDVLFVGTACRPDSSYTWEAASSYEHHKKLLTYRLDTSNESRYRSVDCQLTVLDVHSNDSGIYCIYNKDEGIHVECAWLTVITDGPTCQQTQFSHHKLIQHLCYVSAAGEIKPHLVWNYNGSRFDSNRSIELNMESDYILEINITTSQNDTPQCVMIFNNLGDIKNVPEYYATNYPSLTLTSDCVKKEDKFDVTESNEHLNTISERHSPNDVSSDRPDDKNSNSFWNQFIVMSVISVILGIGLILAMFAAIPH